MTGSKTPPLFRLAYVPGVTPTKWVRIWTERYPGIPLTLVQTGPAEAYGVLRAGEADAGFVRMPVDGDDLSAIPLWTETTVVVIPKDHLLSAAEEVALADLADELVLHPLDDTLAWDGGLPGRAANERPATTGDAIELVAAGVGVLVVPQSLARLHHRKDLTYRPVADAPVSRVALSWPEAATTDQVEDFIGVVRGRTVNSSRGRAQEPAEKTKGAAPRKPTGGKPGGGKPAGGKPSASRSGGKPAAKGKGGRPQPGKSGRSGKPRRRP
ncbi:LysR substrate-binding domain-containing protein [Streptomyces sp. NPDC060194]|uniref:LysR substrate-binding domain-containing protein n=1 Tax=Streptomyces sp. NPDC060194 TaxID=3347069 RepID=UPI0036543A49